MISSKPDGPMFYVSMISNKLDGPMFYVSVISNKLDGPMLNVMIRCAADYYLPKGELSDTCISL